MANQQSLDQNDHPGAGDSGSEEEESQVVTQRTDYKGQYTNLKKKLKFLLYVSSA